MEERSKIINEFNDLITIFNNVSIPIEVTLTFISNNLDIIIDNRDTIKNKLYFIFNKSDVYGIVFAKENEYSWSILTDNSFSKLESIKPESQESISASDYIVEMIIHFANSEKIRKVIPEIDSYSIENKIKSLKDIGLNSNGYHVK